MANASYFRISTKYNASTYHECDGRYRRNDGSTAEVAAVSARTRDSVIDIKE